MWSWRRLSNSWDFAYKPADVYRRKKKIVTCRQRGRKAEGEIQTRVDGLVRHRRGSGEVVVKGGSRVEERFICEAMRRLIHQSLDNVQVIKWILWRRSIQRDFSLSFSDSCRFHLSSSFLLSDAPRCLYSGPYLLRIVGFCESISFIRANFEGNTIGLSRESF